MSQTQQEAYQVMFKNTPQKFYQAVRMLSMMKQAAKAKEQKRLDQTTRENDWEKFKNLREELGLPESPELKAKFMELPREQRVELIRDCEKKLMVQAGEKDYEFLITNNKMLAEPQILDKAINLDQLKNMMTEYGLQFHIKELPDLTKELHFFSKDANIAARAIDRTLETILNDPDTVTKPTFEALMKKAIEQTKEKQEAVKETKEAENPNLPDKASETSKETMEKLSLFDDVKDGIEL
jgi:hypothetical protein